MLCPAPEKKILRRMNYISDQKGILRRFMREDGWKSHVDQAGSFINDVLEKNSFRHIVVLGSGWLLDFPIETALQHVEKITLVDVYFPPPVLKKAKSLANVECIAADITGGFIRSVYSQVRTSKQNFFIPGDVLPPRIMPEKDKLVISLNILNQLDILLVDYIRLHGRYDEDSILNFRKIIQESHINMIREHSFILMTDYREILINSQGNVIEEKELVFTDFPHGDTTNEWEWQFDSHRLYNPHADTTMKVKAVFSKSL